MKLNNIILIIFSFSLLLILLFSSHFLWNVRKNPMPQVYILYVSVLTWYSHPSVPKSSIWWGDRAVCWPVPAAAQTLLLLHLHCEVPCCCFTLPPHEAQLWNRKCKLSQRLWWFLLRQHCLFYSWREHLTAIHCFGSSMQKSLYNEVSLYVLHE